MLRDLYNSSDVVQSIAPQVNAEDDASLDGTGVDLALHSAALVVFDFGASGDSLSGSVSITGVVQESDDNATFTDVADDDLLGTEPVVDGAADDSQTYSVGYIGEKRYVRARLTNVGTHTNGTPCSASIVRAFPRYGQTEAV